MKTLRIIGIALILSALLAVSAPAVSVVSDEFTVARILPKEALIPGNTYDVKVIFTVPHDGFVPDFSDTAPAGWNVSADAAWCSSEAAFSKVSEPATVEYIWFARYAAGTEFTIKYKVTVPANPAGGCYCFTCGTIQYYTEKGGPLYTAIIIGDTEVTVTAATTTTPTTTPSDTNTTGSGGGGGGGGGGMAPLMPTPSSAESVAEPSPSDTPFMASSEEKKEPLFVVPDATTLPEPAVITPSTVIEPQVTLAEVTAKSLLLETAANDGGHQAFACYWWLLISIGAAALITTGSMIYYRRVSKVPVKKDLS